MWDRAEVLSAGHSSGDVEEEQMICFTIIVFVFRQKGESERERR